MQHRIGAVRGECIENSLPVPQIGLHECCVFVDGVAMTELQIVERDHLMPSRKEHFGCYAPNIASRACDQSLHRCSLIRCGLFRVRCGDFGTRIIGKAVCHPLVEQAAIAKRGQHTGTDVLPGKEARQDEIEHCGAGKHTA